MVSLLLLQPFLSRSRVVLPIVVTSWSSNCSVHVSFFSRLDRSRSVAGDQAE